MRLTLILLFFFAAVTPAETARDPILRLFESHYSSAETLQARFLERYLENGRVVRVEAGDAYFLRPGRMRWDYAAPEKNTFLVDGKYVWFYSPSDHTVTRMPTKRSEDWRTPLAFLTTHMKLSRLCSKVEAALEAKPAEAGNTVFHCVLRQSPDSPESLPRSVLFELSTAGELGRIVIPQEGGIEIEFSFTAWRWNPPLEPAVFQFKPPPDTVIVEGLLPDTPGLRQ